MCDPTYCWDCNVLSPYSISILYNSCRSVAESAHMSVSPAATVPAIEKVGKLWMTNSIHILMDSYGSPCIIPEPKLLLVPQLNPCPCTCCQNLSILVHLRAVFCRLWRESQAHTFDMQMAAPGFWNSRVRAQAPWAKCITAMTYFVSFLLLLLSASQDKEKEKEERKEKEKEEKRRGKEEKELKKKEEKLKWKRKKVTVGAAAKQPAEPGD